MVFILTSVEAYVFASIPICMTGKLETTLPEYKSAFLNAVHLALSKSPLSRQQVQVKTYFFDSKPLSPLRAYGQMMRDHCAAIIGFEYLSDLLLIAKFQQDETIPIFTSYASSNYGDKLPKNIFLFMPSYDYQAKKMLEFLNAKFGSLNKVLVITEVDRVDLAKYKIAYEKQFKQATISYEQFDFIGNDELIEKKLASFITNKTYSFVFVFSSAVGSTKIINFMNNHKTIFIGTENFGSSTNQSLFVRLNDKKLLAYIIRNIDFLKQNKELANYRHEYIKQYKTMPNPLSAYTYDAMRIILKTLEKNHVINTKAVLGTDFQGMTGEHIKDGQFYRSNQYVILSISKKGFVYER